MGQSDQVHCPIMSEKLCLKWNDFQENTIAAFGSLRNDNDFSNVTLTCEDGHQVEAHKVILAASSPFFQNMLRKSKHPHPLIYMRGVKSEDLVAIVDFLYYGEANVYQENIDSFLVIASELNLKGLTQKSTEPDEKTNKPKNPSKVVQGSFKPKDSLMNEQKVVEPQFDGTVAVTSFAMYGDINDMQVLDQKVRSLMQKSQHLNKNGIGRAEMCTVCGKEGDQRNIKDHIESKHLEGVSIPCNHCEKTFRTRNGLRSHVRTIMN